MLVSFHEGSPFAVFVSELYQVKLIPAYCVIPALGYSVEQNLCLLKHLSCDLWSQLKKLLFGRTEHEAAPVA